MSRKNFIREKKIYCGKNFLEVDIFPMTEQEKKGRKKKEQQSPQKILNQNDKRARRYFHQLVITNFSRGDYHVSATYKIAPSTPEEAEKNARNFIRRVEYHMKKRNLEFKYIIVTEFGISKKTGKLVRIHHHIIMNHGLERDEIEDLWRERRKKGEKKGKEIGFINADRLKPNEYGLEALCQYLTKSPNNKRRWSPSQNLEKPKTKPNDSKYSRRKIEELAKSDDKSYWEKEYDGYILTECRSEYTDERGWAIFLKMRRLRI